MVNILRRAAAAHQSKCFMSAWQLDFSHRCAIFAGG
uniref:Uncharacterized protein n=1 Tax=Anguilla anguilla TaxID=7936 RepID=A0A0E9WAP8_ANGAN